MCIRDRSASLRCICRRLVVADYQYFILSANDGVMVLDRGDIKWRDDMACHVCRIARHLLFSAAWPKRDIHMADYKNRNVPGFG